MSGIKDLHGLLFWLDNSKQLNMERVLSNKRTLSKEKETIMRELAEEHGARHLNGRPPHVNARAKR